MTDSIDRQAALDALADAMPSLTTPDGCGQFDHDIQVTDEAYVDCMQIIHELPSVQPGWIPCSKRCPEHRVYVLVTYKPVYGIPDIGITWYSKSEGKWNTSRKVLAWMEMPKPYCEDARK